VRLFDSKFDFLRIHRLRCRGNVNKLEDRHGKPSPRSNEARRKQAPLDGGLKGCLAEFAQELGDIEVLYPIHSVFVPDFGILRRNETNQISLCLLISFLRLT
jgi:hypothetical protein